MVWEDEIYKGVKLRVDKKSGEACLMGKESDVNYGCHFSGMITSIEEAKEIIDAGQYSENDRKRELNREKIEIEKRTIHLSDALLKANDRLNQINIELGGE